MEEPLNHDKFIEQLNKHWVGGKNCPICKQNSWLMPVELSEIRTLNWGKTTIGATTVLPIVPLTCTVCGNTLFFNAVVLGLIEHQKSIAATSPLPKEGGTP